MLGYAGDISPLKKAERHTDFSKRNLLLCYSPLEPLARANTIQEATKLIENGYEYVTEINGTKLFRKRK